jgi:CASC3/Barentsz eIF4AIII binding
MPSLRHKNIVPSRRRRDDDDDESSMAADVEEDSLSEGSPISNGDDDADVEGSETSEQEISRDPDIVQPVGSPNGAPLATDVSKNGHAKDEPSKTNLNGAFKNSADTNVMLNGLKVSGDADIVEEINFEDSTADMSTSPLKPVQAPSETGRQETLAERNRREHQEYLKKRDENPAFVPNRGGFFLHDNRSGSAGANGARPSARGRGRGSFVGMHSS